MTNFFNKLLDLNKNFIQKFQGYKDFAINI